MWAIYDSINLEKPYIFQDEDKFAQTPAIFRSYEVACTVANKMTSGSSNRSYVVKFYIPGPVAQ